MKTMKRLLSVTLAMALVLSVAGCKGRQKRMDGKLSIETEEMTETYPSLEPTDVPTDTTPTDTVPTDTTAPSTGLNLQAPVPVKNCAIDFPTDKRFHYDLGLELDTKNRTVSGHVVIQFFNNSDKVWTELCFRDYSSLFKDEQTSGVRGSDGAMTEITNITYGNSTLDYERDDDVSVVWVPLPQPLEPDQEATLSYDFVAKIPTLADRYGVYQDVFNVTNFYPILAVYTDDGWSHEAFYNMGECFYSEVSDYHVMLTVPSDYMILSTGTDEVYKQDGDKTMYSIDAPCVRDFVFCASAGFKLFEGDYKDVHIRVVYDEKHPASNEMDACAEASLKAAQDSLAAFGAAFGEYPYPELDIILAPIDAGGMEYPNLIICTAVSYYCMQLPGETIPFQLMCIVVAHEIGHQWFMGIVGSNSGMEPWLDESFASYTEIVYCEYMGISSEIDRYSRSHEDLSNPNVYKPLEQMDQIPVNRSYYSFKSTNAYVYAAYEIGKQALYQMEEIVGREEFHGIIREYVRRNAFTNSTQARFFEVLFECAGQDNQDLNNLVNAVFDI